MSAIRSHTGFIEEFAMATFSVRGLRDHERVGLQRPVDVTIERLLSKSDLEVGLEAALGHLPSWGVPESDVRQRDPKASE